MEKWIHAMAVRQAEKKRIPASDIEILQYGYRLMAEKICALALTIMIAGIMGAWREAFLFCVAFIPLRVYAGGYHAAGTGYCMVLSALVLIVQVYAVRWLIRWDMGLWPIGMEIVLFLLLLYFSPVETGNRRIGKSEKRYFHKMVCFIYGMMLIVEIIMMMYGYMDIPISFMSAHFTNVMTVFFGAVIQKRNS